VRRRLARSPSVPSWSAATRSLPADATVVRRTQTPRRTRSSWPWSLPHMRLAAGGLRVARSTSRWSLASCAGLMVNARIDRCVYGAANPKGGALGTVFDVSHTPELNHEFEVVPGVLAEECAGVMRDFFRSRRG